MQELEAAAANSKHVMAALQQAVADGKADAARQRDDNIALRVSKDVEYSLANACRLPHTLWMHPN